MPRPSFTNRMRLIYCNLLYHLGQQLLFSWSRNTSTLALIIREAGVSHRLLSAKLMGIFMEFLLVLAFVVSVGEESSSIVP